MNSQNAFGSNSKLETASEAEGTLRLIASLPAPEGIEGRVISGLRSKPSVVKVLNWPRMMSPTENWFRSAAAAAIVCVVVGGGWGIYSRVQSNNATTAPHAGPANGFSNAGAVRVPQTVPAPVAVQPVQIEPTKKPPTEAVPALHHRSAKAAASKKAGTKQAPAVAR